MQRPAFPLNPVLPAHVTPDQVFDFDVYHPSETHEDVFVALNALLDPRIPDIFWTRNNGGHWIVKRGEYYPEIARTPEIFSSSRLIVPDQLNDTGKLIPIHLDPPEHTKFRALLTRALSPRKVADMQAGVRELTVSLIEALRPQGRCDFVADFAFQMPIGVFMRLVDLPMADRLPLLEIVGGIIKPDSGSKAEVMRALTAYIEPVVAARRQKPGADLISWLGQAEISGRRITHEELLSMASLLLIGGLDSVANTLGFIARFLADSPGFRRRVRATPQRLRETADELLRRFPVVVGGGGRYVVQDVSFHGVDMRAGDHVLLPPALFNFDSERFPDPLDVDADRGNAVIGTFGHGAHRCVGESLARAEIAIFLEEWLTRIPEFEVLPGTVVHYEPGVNAGLRALPLAWPV